MTENPEWKAVGAPQAQAGPPLPHHVRVGGLVLLGLLLIGAVIAGIGLGGGFSAAPSPSASPSPELKMEPPLTLGSYVRGELKKSDDGTLTSADYSDGSASIVLIMRWPQKDVGTFMGDAGFTASASPQPSPDATASGSGDPIEVLCGSSKDYSADSTVGCGTVERDTGLMVVALSAQDEEEIRDLLRQFEQAVAA